MSSVKYKFHIHITLEYLLVKKLNKQYISYKNTCSTHTFHMTAAGSQRIKCTSYICGGDFPYH